ncbi:MFS transporter [Solirubrobacter sp. CPCC 204708]|uniref:MFS transporter n=1 Tax=Solirubrobacter deserti TaxID=2282478 RepID=A0ABT4RU78_9ACTN|nr:MFS transporter [Solirubrobacter deserti]MBE2316334.1 MFS transporter [Solirubrobacter deserti]MDA0142134.1 MFS transporter [Solirubrobacter deserti]
MDRRGLATLASGHAAADLCQGSIPALIPFLVHQRGYSFGAAGALLLVVTIGSSIIQPLFGALSDRLQLAWLMPAGVALAAVGIAGAGVFDSFALTCIVVGLGGLGVAAFHPEGARYANYASGDRRGTGMSLFSVGGNAGFALAPVLITPAVLAVGLNGTLIVAILPAIAAVVLAIELPKLKRRSAAAASAVAKGQSDRSGDRWGAFSTLAGVVSIRSGIYFGLQSFAPLWLIHTYGASEATGNAALAAMLFAGALGTLIGGQLVDRIGRRKVLVGSIVAQVPLLLAFMLSPSGILAGIVLAGIGFVTVMSFSVSVVMGQEYLPSRLGIASGVTLGFSIGVGGVFAALFGIVADSAGLETVMWIVAALPLAGLALALTLPLTAQEERISRPTRAATARTGR